jgi:hypothetical protein
MCDLQFREVALRDPSAVARVHQRGDAVEEAVPGRRVEGEMAGVGMEQLTVLECRVRNLPFVAAEAGGLEAP